MNTFLIRGPCLTLEKLAMKKSLIALAVLTASGISFAQSSVTMFGVVDAAYAKGTGSLTDKTQLKNSGHNSSRFGVRGTEDLGGGLKASFWLEAGVNNDDGSGSGTSNNNQGAAAFDAVTGKNATVESRNQGLTFNRRSTVSLEGSFGEVRLGRDYTPQFWTETAFDPFGTNGVGTNIAFNKGGTTGVRASNSIGYLSPSFNGVKVWAQTYMGENASTDGAGGGVSQAQWTCVVSHADGIAVASLGTVCGCVFAHVSLSPDFHAIERWRQVADAVGSTNASCAAFVEGNVGAHAVGAKRIKSSFSPELRRVVTAQTHFTKRTFQAHGGTTVESQTLVT